MNSKAQKSKSILILSHSSEIGGAELSMLDFFDYWQAKEPGLKPFFIIKAPAKRLASQLKKRGWEYKAIQYTSWSSTRIDRERSSRFRNSKKNTKAIIKINKLISEYKPDAVMTNTLVAPWAAFAAKLKGLPHVWFVREFGDIDHSHQFERGREDTLADIGLLSDLVVANSNLLNTHLGGYIDKNKIITLYTPFKTEKIKKLAGKRVRNPYKDKEAIKLIMVGVIKPSKGQELTIKALAKLKEKGVKAEVCFVGHASPPEYLDKLKTLAKEKGVEQQVRFLGKKPNPYAYVDHADIGIMSSKMEAFGRVTFEYLVLGKPVIGAASGGTLEMIQDDHNGFLFRPGNTDQLVRKIEYYAANPDILKQHKSNAAASATKMLTGENSADKCIDEIERVINSKDIYKLPNYVQSWLEIPDTARAPSRLLLVPRIKRAIELGPKGSAQRIQFKINQKFK